MYRAFNTAVTGLQANQTRMEVIGNNIANVNTTAYKGSRATFEEQFAQTLSSAQEPTGARGGTNPRQIGLGTRVASIDTIHTQGAIQTTGKNTDVAMQGDGFFVMRDSNNQRLYTRDGNLSVDGEGRLVNNSGLIVQGYAADGRGVINPNGAVEDLRIETNRTFPPQSTSRVDIAGNLYRSPDLDASSAFAHAIQNGVAAGVPVNGFGNGAGSLQLGATDNDTLNAGEFTINDVSILGQVPVAAGDNTQSVMQKLADLINFHRDETGVLATVRTTSAGGSPEVEIALTQLRPGTDRQIVLGGSDINNVTLNSTQIFTAGTTTTQTTANNTTGQAQTGSQSLVSGDIIVNGVDIGALPATPASNTPEQNAQAIVGLINAKTDLTGVTGFTDGNGRISLRSIARDIILTGRTVADGPTPVSPTPGGGVNVSGLFTGLNRAKTATVLAGTTSDVFDSLGAQHSVGLEFVADYDVVRDGAGIVQGTRDSGIWSWAATSDEQDVAVLSVNGQAGNTTAPLRSVAFSDRGLLENFTGQFTLNFLNADAVTSTSIFQFNSNLSPNVSAPQPLSVDVGTVNDTDGLTQFSGPLTLTVADQDGYSAGDLTNFTFAPDGTVRGVFSNGQILSLGRMAVASFANESGLIRGNLSTGGGGNVFQETANSGEPRIGSAQAGGNGSIVGGALEGSNVDLAEQFTDMIVTQRAFQANSRTITTADEMLQEILSLRR